MMQVITTGTLRKMHGELSQLESQALEELKTRKTRALGALRLDLVEECRRRLAFLAAARRNRLDQYPTGRSRNPR